MKFLLFIVILSICLPAFSQQVPPAEYGHNSSFNNYAFIKTDSGIIINHNYRKCKNVISIKEFVRIKVNANAEATPLPNPSFAAKKIQFLTIHGNVSYDFFYRSKLDTPIAQQNFYQHTEKVYLNILLKEKYPLKVAFVLRQSNSPWFKNFADINLHFDHFGYYKNLKQDIINKLSKSLGNRPDINALKNLMEEKEKQFLTLKDWLGSPATLQKIIEEREREYARQNSSMPDSTVMPAINDPMKHGIISPFTKMYETKKEEAGSLSKQVILLHQTLDSTSNDVQKRLAGARQKIYKAGNERDIRKIAADNGINVAQNKFESKLAAIKTFSIGRSMVNYTELTAQNIAITGLNMEYNPSYYAAFTAGKIDYRFRDFFNKNTNSNGQYLVLGRVGIGDPQRKALIFTAFQGRKNSAEFILNDTAATYVNIAGYSIESILKKDENTSISFEVAKSTKPITGNLNKQINTLWKFSDQSNLGVNIKGQTLIPQTNTKLSGFYRKTGENFQSFSLFSYNTDQTAWLARGDQYLFKQKINVTGMLRRNDFTNPFTDKAYKTSTVFKSILLNIKIPKYPFLNLGYFPGSQLYIINKEKIRENVYYLLNGSLMHSYFYKGTGMNSSLVYNQYFNQATDSGFVYYKGTSYYAAQTIFLKNLQFQAGYSFNNQPELKYFTLETSGDYTLKQFLKIAVGVKYNKINVGNSYWGETIRLGADFKQSGRLQFQYEKNFLPTTTHTLYPIEIGRVSWSKYF